MTDLEISRMSVSDGLSPEGRARDRRCLFYIVQGKIESTRQQVEALLEGRREELELLREESDDDAEPRNLETIPYMRLLETIDALSVDTHDLEAYLTTSFRMVEQQQPGHALPPPLGEDLDEDLGDANLENANAEQLGKFKF